MSVALSFSDAAAVAILQARHEALAAGGTVVTPAHLALGVLWTAPAPLLDALCPSPELFHRLVVALGGREAAAPLVPREVSYAPAAGAALEEAGRCLTPGTPRGAIEPIHILIGILAAEGPLRDPQTTMALSASGLTTERLQFIARSPGRGPR